MAEHVQSLARRSLQAWAMTACFGGSMALGQGEPAAKPQPTLHAAAPAQGDVLAGPKVEAEAQKPETRPMALQMRNPSERIEIPFQQWMIALRELNLSDEQQTNIRATADEFRQAQREFQQTHREKLGQLREQLLQARQAGHQPSKELRQQFQKIEAERPKPGAFQTRIWNLLNQQQQGQMKQTLDEMQQRMMERRQASLTEDQPGKSAANGKGSGDVDCKHKPHDQNPQARQGEKGKSKNKHGQRLRPNRSVNHPKGEPTEKEKQFKFDDE